MTTKVKQGVVDLSSLTSGLALGQILIETKTASSSASLSFTSLTGYDAYLFQLQNLKPATNAVNLQIQFSINNGSSYDSTADYHYAQVGITYTGTGSDGGGTAAYFSPVTGVSNAAGTGISGDIKFIGLNDTNTKICYGPYNLGWWTGTTHQIVMGQFIKGGAMAGGVNAVSFYFSSGNIASGDITVYGLRT